MTRTPGAGGQGRAEDGRSGQGGGDVVDGGEHELVVGANFDGGPQGQRAEFVLDVAAAEADLLAVMDELRGEHGGGVGVGRSILAGVGVKPQAELGDIAGLQAP